MIRTFNARRILFTPVSWLNSVANWLLGIHSDSGTVKITNTASPGDTGPSVDVDVPTVAKKLDTYLKDSYPKVRDTKLLGASLKWENGQLEVDDNWLKARVIDNDVTEEPETTSCTTVASGANNGAGDGWETPMSDTGVTINGSSETGVIVYIATRAATNSADVGIMFRPFKITSDGRICSIGSEEQVLSY